ncbi:hypothetical protein, partial [Mesorhizobium sp. M7A.F.Ca.CA.004.06.1.1]|uniref:hypothetical protein n=1 Tax=Mesorhizobium sp. M7A.F.Ca.CA.004.06.1.1 TaxID=2496686 RepID=UPI0019CFA35B
GPATTDSAIVPTENSLRKCLYRMIKSEIASCRSRPWLRKISLRDRQHDWSDPQKPDRIVAVLFTLCDAKMAKCLAITIARQRTTPACPNSEMEPSCQS